MHPLDLVPVQLTDRRSELLPQALALVGELWCVLIAMLGDRVSRSASASATACRSPAAFASLG
jgi:hypothetical protein